MFNVNRVTLLGRATHDPEAKATKTGLSVTNIALATNGRKKDDKGNYVDDAEYHRLVCFGQLAEFSTKSISKGTPLYVEGRLHTSRFKNKEGKETSRTEILVDQLVLLSAKQQKAMEAAEAVAA